MDNLNVPGADINYTIVHSVMDLPGFNTDEPIFADIETDDLYGPTRMIQLYQPSINPTIYILDIAPIGYNKDDWHRELLNVEDFIMRHFTVWYNSSYDLGTLNISPSMGAKHPDEITNLSKYDKRVEDLFYAVRTAYPEFMNFGLKEIVKKLRYTQGLYKDIKTKDAVKGFVRGAYISNQAYRYAALDVYALSLMWTDKKIQNVIQNNLAYKVDMISQAYALIYQQNGLKMDRGMWIEKLENAEEQVIKYRAELPNGLNPNSYKQVRALLNITESDHKALVAHALSDLPTAPYGQSIILLKKYMKQVSYLKSVNFDTMYTKFNAAGAISGRFTASGGSLPNGFNSQQIPREFQPLFTQNTETTRVIDLDYSTLELRLACAIYGADHMYKQFMDGRDLHLDMAILATGKVKAPDDVPNLDSKGLLPLGEFSDDYVTFQDRADAKAINFGYVFGMSAAAYKVFAFTAYGVKVSEEESQNLRNKYFELYPEIKKYHNYVWNNYKKPGFTVQTALGRRVKPKLGTDGINIPVQGTGGETTKLGVHYMVQEDPLVLKRIYNVVHDCVYSRTSVATEEYENDLVGRNMVKGWTEISKTPMFKYKDIPMIVEH